MRGLLFPGKIGVVSLLFVVSVLCQVERRVTVEGIVTNDEEKPLPYANIVVKGIGCGAVSDLRGRFSLELPSEGKYRVIVSYIGYEREEFIIDTKSSRQKPIKVVLKASEIKFSPVTVLGKEYRDREMQIETSIKMFDNHKFLSVPTPGIGDILWVLQMTPETKSVSEYSNQPCVRGGSPDQNLMLLNGAPILPPSHMFGVISSFDKGAIESVKYFTGAFSVKYGDRLSSVVEIETKPGSDKLSVESDINVTSLSSTVSGSLFRKLRWRMTVRCARYDRIIKSVPYRFHDVESRLSFVPTKDMLVVYNYFSSYDSYHPFSKTTYIIYGPFCDIQPAERSDPDSNRCYFLDKNNYTWGEEFHSIRMMKKYRNPKVLIDFIAYSNRSFNRIYYVKALFPSSLANQRTINKVARYNRLYGYNPIPLRSANLFYDRGFRVSCDVSISDNLSFVSGFDYSLRKLDYSWNTVDLKVISRYVNIFMDTPPDSFDYEKVFNYKAGYAEMTCKFFKVAMMRMGLILSW